jgi:hypothetical protein
MCLCVECLTTNTRLPFCRRGWLTFYPCLVTRSPAHALYSYNLIRLQSSFTYLSKQPIYPPPNLPDQPHTTCKRPIETVATLPTPLPPTRLPSHPAHHLSASRTPLYRLTKGRWQCWSLSETVVKTTGGRRSSGDRSHEGTCEPEEQVRSRSECSLWRT